MCNRGYVLIFISHLICLFNLSSTDACPLVVSAAQAEAIAMPVTNAQQPTHADALAVVVEEAVVAVLAEGAPQPAVLDARDVTLATASLKMGRAATEELDVTARYVCSLLTPIQFPVGRTFN